MSRQVVITGAGTGIGKAIAHSLAQEDFSLILLARNLDRLDETRSNLENPDQHQCFECDVRDKQSLDTALKQSGVESLYAVIINAGIGGENHAGVADRWQEIVDTNLTGSYNTAQACLPYLKNNKEGYKKMLFISSILARLGVPGYSAYCASKAGLLGLMRSLASELASEKILVNALCPGWVNTDMAMEGLDGFAEALKITRDEAYQEAMKAVPLGKMSEPIEVAAYVRFLLSGQQTSITGQTLDFNNGAMMP